MSDAQQPQVIPSARERVAKMRKDFEARCKKLEANIETSSTEATASVAVILTAHAYDSLHLCDLADILLDAMRDGPDGRPART